MADKQKLTISVERPELGEEERTSLSSCLQAEALDHKPVKEDAHVMRQTLGEDSAKVSAEL